MFDIINYNYNSKGKDDDCNNYISDNLSFASDSGGRL